MAQEIMWDFNADDKTLWLNNEKMGLFYSGVQKGFKVIRGSNAGMNFSFLHDFPKPGESILDGTDGATNAANRLTSATSDFSAYAVGDVLEVFDRTSTGDNGLYIITTVAPGGNVTQIDVHRNFPTGSLANLRFRVCTPVGVILTEDHAVVREFGCQDNVDALANGGGSLRHDVIFARYIYNASSPPNTCSYLKASCTSLVTGADGSATPKVNVDEFDSDIHSHGLQGVKKVMFSLDEHLGSSRRFSFVHGSVRGVTLPKQPDLS